MKRSWSTSHCSQAHRCNRTTGPGNYSTDLYEPLPTALGRCGAVDSIIPVTSAGSGCDETVDLLVDAAMNCFRRWVPYSNGCEYRSIISPYLRLCQHPVQVGDMFHSPRCESTKSLPDDVALPQLIVRVIQSEGLQHCEDVVL